MNRFLILLLFTIFVQSCTSAPVTPTLSTSQTQRRSFYQKHFSSWSDFNSFITTKDPVFLTDYHNVSNECTGQVNIYNIRISGDESAVCVGSFITNNLFVTAGHCLLSGIKQVSFIDDDDKTHYFDASFSIFKQKDYWDYVDIGFLFINSRPNVKSFCLKQYVPDYPRDKRGKSIYGAAVKQSPNYAYHRSDSRSVTGLEALTCNTTEDHEWQGFYRNQFSKMYLINQQFGTYRGDSGAPFYYQEDKVNYLDAVGTGGFSYAKSCNKFSILGYVVNYHVSENLKQWISIPMNVSRLNFCQHSPHSANDLNNVNLFSTLNKNDNRISNMLNNFRQFTRSNQNNLVVTSKNCKTAIKDSILFELVQWANIYWCIDGFTLLNCKIVYGVDKVNNIDGVDGINVNVCFDDDNTQNNLIFTESQPHLFSRLMAQVLFGVCQTSTNKTSIFNSMPDDATTVLEYDKVIKSDYLVKTGFIEHNYIQLTIKKSSNFYLLFLFAIPAVIGVVFIVVNKNYQKKYEQLN